MLIKKIFGFTGMAILCFLVFSMTGEAKGADTDLLKSVHGIEAGKGGDTDKEAFEPRLTAPERSDVWYYELNRYYTHGYGMPNCTAYAYGRAYEILGEESKLPTRGNAGSWYKTNKTNWDAKDTEISYPYGDTPRVGAIACWDKNDDNWGHVAVVESIEDGIVTYSESQYGGLFFNTFERELGDNSYWDGFNFKGFIYVLDDEEHITEE